MKKRILTYISSMVAGLVIILMSISMAFAIVYIPVPSYTLIAPTIPGYYISFGSSSSAYYTIGFASTVGGGSTPLVPGVEPLPTLNPDNYNFTPGTNPLTPLVAVWADLWTVDISIGWILGSMFLAICTFIYVAYKFQHVGFAMSAACVVLGFFSYPDVHILPTAVFIMAIVGLIAGVVIEARA